MVNRLAGILAEEKSKISFSPTKKWQGRRFSSLCDAKLPKLAKICTQKLFQYYRRIHLFFY